MAKCTATAVSLFLFFVSVAGAGSVLDEILNGMRLGAHTPARDESRSCDIGAGGSVGQTFRVGPDVEKVFRIAVWQAFWHESWQPDKVLVLTLWDSPAKNTAYGRYGVPYARRMWEGATPMFSVDARVAPEREYYFELTVEIEPLRPATVPTEWQLTKSRPGFAGGTPELAGIGVARGDYADGTAYIDGEPRDFDLWFEIGEIRRADRDALYGEAFARYDLERSELARVAAAVTDKDWDRAASELVRHFEGRADLFPQGDPAPRLDLAFDTTQADLAAEHKVLLDDGTTVDLGPEWNHYTLWPERGGVGLTRAGLRKYLAAGYSHTGNEKYARAWNDLLYHLFIQSPSPLRAGAMPDRWGQNPSPGVGLAGGSMWAGLSIGARLGHGFSYYAAFLRSPSFTQDLRAAFVIDLGEMADVFERQKGGGNWDTQMTMGLMECGLNYPEFKRAKQWVQDGFDGLVHNALDNVYPDGVAHEPTVNYHGMMMRRYARVMQQAEGLGLVVPATMAQLTEKMYEFLMHSTMPDGRLVAWGDSWTGSEPDDLVRDATFFRRPDFLYVGTRGREGTPPDRTSFGFPRGGFYYMRTGWDDRAHFMGLRCGPFGSHGHYDALSLVVAAHGRTVLHDPGICTYGTPEARELTASRSHSTVTVGDRDARSAEAVAWRVSEGFDFFAGHNHGYDGLDGVRHHRRVWFLKPGADRPGLWLVFDDVAGAGPHDVALRFRFNKLPVQADPDAARVWTGGEGGNLLIRVPDADPDALTLNEGIATVPGIDGLTTVPVAAWTHRGDLPAGITSLLLPFMDDKVPAASVELLAASPEQPGARAAWVVLGNQAVLALVGALAPAASGEPSPVEVAVPDAGTLRADASAAAVRFLRRDGRWRPTALYGVDMREAALDGTPLYAGPERAEAVERALDPL